MTGQQYEHQRASQKLADVFLVSTQPQTIWLVYRLFGTTLTQDSWHWYTCSERPGSTASATNICWWPHLDVHCSKGSANAIECSDKFQSFSHHVQCIKFVPITARPKSRPLRLSGIRLQWHSHWQAKLLQMPWLQMPPTAWHLGSAFWYPPNSHALLTDAAKDASYTWYLGASNP